MRAWEAILDRAWGQTQTIERHEPQSVRIILHKDGRGLLEKPPTLPQTIDGECSDDAELLPEGEAAEPTMRYDRD